MPFGNFQEVAEMSEEATASRNAETYNGAIFAVSQLLFVQRSDADYHTNGL